MPLMLAAWLHDLSPFLVRFGSGFGLRWYGLAYLCGFLAGWLMLRWLSRRGVTPLTPLQITDAMVALVLGVVLGGRLGYVLFYEPTLLWTFVDGLPWWGVLTLNKGGMSSHGGMLGVIIACFWVTRQCRRQGHEGLPVRHVIDLAAIGCLPGLFFGRIANFINGELLAKIVARPGEPAPRWTVKFPQEVLSGHETLRTDEQTQRLLDLVARYTVGGESFDDAFDRVLRTLQAGGAEAERVAAELGPLISARHPSQLYQAVTDGVVLGVLLMWVWARPRLPGVVGSWFLIGYGVMRITTELYRLPDDGVGRILGLSRGQLLSVGMILVGAVALVLIRRSGGRRFGGWLRREAAGPARGPDPAA